MCEIGSSDNGNNGAAIVADGVRRGLKGWVAIPYIRLTERCIGDVGAYVGIYRTLHIALRNGVGRFVAVALLLFPYGFATKQQQQEN